MVRVAALHVHSFAFLNLFGLGCRTWADCWQVLGRASAADSLAVTRFAGFSSAVIGCFVMFADRAQTTMYSLSNRRRSN